MTTATEAAPEISTDPYHWIAVLGPVEGGLATVPEVAPDGTVIHAWGAVPTDQLTAVCFGYHDESGEWQALQWVDRPAGGSLRVFRRRTLSLNFETGTQDYDPGALVAELTHANGAIMYVSLRNGRVPWVTADETQI